MGLTIHYELQTSIRSAAKARQLVEQLRQKALDLPFAAVGEIVDVCGESADFNEIDQDDPNRWLLIQAVQYVVRDGQYISIHPTHLIAFSTVPGDGSEPANFGLAVYPKTIEFNGKRLRTNLGDWTWSSFCKTQYASNPAVGGIENFLRSHLSIVKLLDCADQLGILRDVRDEGQYWEKRDLKALISEVGEWNTMIAGWAGRLKDSFGNELVSEITKYPNFEHLEADSEKRE